MQRLKIMVESGQSNSYAGATASEAARLMAQALSAASIENPATDARLLVPAALGCSKQDFIMHPQRLVTPDEARQLQQFEKRRAAYEPVSRILGSREFYGRSFEITPDTLDPRPDSETLVEAALELARERDASAGPLRILDIGTGTGCLLLTLLAELPGGSMGLGTDISVPALTVAARNAATLGLADRVRWQQTHSLTGITGPFDLIISNPPYIPTPDLAGLAPDVRLYDPLTALDGGFDGLQVYREIIAGLAAADFESALFEVGAGQAADLELIVRDKLGSKVRRIKRWSDLGGHCRCVAVQTHL